MKRAAFVAACAAMLAVVPVAPAYVEVPYTLGRICQESTNIVLVEVVKVNKEKNLIIFKKLEDLKGKHDKDEIKHNIDKRGYHPREWQNIMAWAEAGKKAVFFHNGAIHSLRDAVAFYATRDSNPARWYPHGKFDDLPAPARTNVEAGPPFAARPPLTKEEIDDVVAFLRTLTDGWRHYDR